MRRAFGPTVPRLAGLVAFLKIGPFGFAANTMLVEALHGAAATRPFIVFTFPFVVEARILVEHARADALRRLEDLFLSWSLQMLSQRQLPAQIVDDRGKPEACAPSRVTLIHHQAAILREIFCDQLFRGIPIRQADETRPVEQVTKIDPIRSGIEFARTAEKDLGWHVPSTKMCAARQTPPTTPAWRNAEITPIVTDAA